MFVSAPDFHMKVPAGMGHPGHQYWRGLSLSVEWAWFVVKLRLQGPRPVLNTFLLGWDIDVVDALRPPSIVLESLLCVAPSEQGWQPIVVVEVWEAAGTGPEAGRTIYFVDRAGFTYEGMELRRVPKPLGRLVARAMHADYPYPPSTRPS